MSADQSVEIQIKALMTLVASLPQFRFAKHARLFHTIKAVKKGSAFVLAHGRCEIVFNQLNSC
jgi:hypothetical protein